MSDAQLSVVLRRRYRASQESVFAAFADAGYLARWLSPSDEVKTEVTDFDFRVGGRYRLGFSGADEKQSFVSGEYVEIDRPERLIFTWTWEDPSPHAGIETLVTVDILDRGDETEIVLTHERFPDQDLCDRHNEGWSGAFDRFQTFIGTME